MTIRRCTIVYASAELFYALYFTKCTCPVYKCRVFNHELARLNVFFPATPAFFALSYQNLTTRHI